VYILEAGGHVKTGAERLSRIKLMLLYYLLWLTPVSTKATLPQVLPRLQPEKLRTSIGTFVLRLHDA
jgi:hypothetical protein